MVQLDAFSAELRDAVAETLIAIGGAVRRAALRHGDADDQRGVRAHVGRTRRAAPAEEYWPLLIGRVKAAHPDLVLIAEAYWDMEWTLQQQGFDYCYDKRLYDRLAHESAESVRGHLQADAAYQERLIRFIENHDEPRAAATFGPGAGARRRRRDVDAPGRAPLPRRPARRPPDPHPGVPRPRAGRAARRRSAAFYERLLRAVAESDLRHGDWRLCEATGWPDNDSHRRLVAWCWSTADARHLVVVNLSGAPAQARVHLPWADLAGRDWELADRLDGARFERGGDELAGEGLYVALEPWASHFLAL